MNYINVKLITLNPECMYIENGFVKTVADKITAVGKMDDYTKTEDEEEENAAGKILMPGLICAHSHFYGQLIRGLSMKKSMCNWQQILSRMWWNVDRALDEEMNYASAMMGLVEGVKSGVTTYVDHHASPSVCMGSLDTLESAVNDVGARAILAYEVSDRNGKTSADEGIRENVRFLKKNRSAQDNVRAMFGLHALYTLSEETLKKAVEAEKDFDCGFHIHMAEDMADVADSYRLYDMSPAEKLLSAGIIKPGTMLAHVVNVKDRDMNIIKDAGAYVAHNVRSNTNNAVGTAPINKMMDMGIKVVLGGDGYDYDLFREYGFAAILQKLNLKDPTVFGNDKRQNFVFYNNFSFVSEKFDAPIGMIKEGNKADFIMLDYIPPTPMDGNNFMFHCENGFSGHVTDTIIGGKRIVKDRNLLTVDEEKTLYETRRQAQRLAKAL